MFEVGPGGRDTPQRRRAFQGNWVSSETIVSPRTLAVLPKGTTASGLSAPAPPAFPPEAVFIAVQIPE